ncbi:MAG: bifunctional oligoribonuclease/PAP phosphatase NrnA [Chloroflexi bacterium]|nr:MAG: bifunctional oligoribonuclease/PAP phosphatase NrnA [Chloroflexota bacterium]
MSLTTNKIQQAVEQAEQILLITHVDPDGDAIGSITAVALALTQLGKQVTLACDNRSPSRFKYLAMSGDLQQSLDETQTYDLLIAVDCGDELRMGKVFAQMVGERPFLINIDHHITNTQFGDVNLVNPVATSTTEMLYKLFTNLEWPISPEIALSLLTGLVTDTLGFRTVGVTPITMKTASALMDAGADLSLVTMQALNLKPLSTLKLWKSGLNNLQLDDGLIWTSISNDEREESGYTSASTGGLVNLMADIDQAAMSAVLLEMPNGVVRVGFRCRPPYSVSDLAADLGGGGHPLAAGCTLLMPLDEAEALVVQRSKEAIQQQRLQSKNGQPVR